MFDNQEELFAYIVLSQIRGLSTALLSELSLVPGQLQEILKGSCNVAEKSIQVFLQNKSLLDSAKRLAISQLEWLNKHKIYSVSKNAKAYPQQLLNVADAPPWLFIKGNHEALQGPAIAIVGSRRASGFGRDLAHVLGRELGSLGVSVISGLARGIDTAAHQGALQAGGTTFAVFGCGIDRVYPAENIALARKINDNGGCISEYPPGTPPWPGNFPRRNRIIAGLCLAVIVVEAGLRSGSLITARLAMEYNRDVFAVPGSIISEGYKGCHYLIKNGAKLLENMQDIEEEILAVQELVKQVYRQEQDKEEVPAKDSTRETIKESTSASEKEKKKLLAILSEQTLSVEDLQSKLQVNISALLSLLTQLEMDNKIVRSGCGYRVTVGSRL